ncbi:MAG: DUF4124 domain-containing protein [bacterium]|nr:DUF4124 domain-containing protein [bacterium]
MTLLTCPKTRFARPLLPAALVLLATALCGSGASADEIYRWTDAQGRVHFSSTPPPGAAEWQSKRDALNIVPELNRPAGKPESSVEAQRARARAAAMRSRNGAPAAASSQAPSPSKTIAGQSRKQWHDDALAKQQRVRSLEKSVERLEDQMSFPSRVRSSMRRALIEDRQERRLNKLKAQLEEAEDTLGDFEADAQRSGVPAAWLP